MIRRHALVWGKKGGDLDRRRTEFLNFGVIPAARRDKNGLSRSWSRAWTLSWSWADYDLKAHWNGRMDRWLRSNAERPASLSWRHFTP